MPSIERRKARSPWASEALGHQLQQIADRHGLDRVVLADRRGQLWAASRVDSDAADLAAALPELATATGLEHGKRARGRLRIEPLEVGRAPLLLAASGRSPGRGLREAAVGVRRILCGLLTP